MKNLNLTTIIILLLVLLNSATLAFMWFGKPPCPPMAMPPQDMPHQPHPPHGGPGQFITHELNFDDAQKQKFEKLKEMHHKKAIVIQDSMHTLKEKLFNDIPSGDMARAEQIAGEIASLQKQLELITFEHFKQVRDLCTDDQKKIFDRIINRVLEMMAPPPFPPPPGPRGPHGPPPPPRP